MSRPLTNGMSVGFQGFVRSSSRSRPLRARQPAGARASLRCEPLEDRQLLTVSANQAFVATLYQGLLQRDAEPTGLAGWTSVLDGGASRTQVVQAFVGSAEYRNDEAQGLYQSLLGRAADAGGLTGWSDALASGTDYAQVKAAFLGSDEYFQRAGDNVDAYVKSLYEEDLGRAPDQGGEAAWSSTLQDGVPRSTVAEAFATSPEAEQREVVDDYQQVLSRDPDPAGLTGWTSAIEQSDGDNTPVATAMLASNEFANQEASVLGTLSDQVTDPNSATRQFLSKTGKRIGDAITQTKDYLGSVGYTPALAVTGPDTFMFSALEGNKSATPPTATFTITNTGKRFSTLAFTVRATTASGGSWLEVQPSNGSLAAGQTVTCTVIVHPENFTDVTGVPAPHKGSIVVSDASGDSKSLGVVLTINPTSGIQGTYSGNYTAMAYTLEGQVSISGSVTVRIDSAEPTSLSGVSKITGQVTITGVSGQPIQATFIGTLDNTTNTITLGEIGTTIQVFFDGTTLNGNSIKTTFGILQGSDVVVSGVSVTLKKQ